jgi:hypothetical protein
MPFIYGVTPGAEQTTNATPGTENDSFFLKGKVPLWNQMGHGNWATDPTYASKVLLIYFDMINFAAKRMVDPDRQTGAHSLGGCRTSEWPILSNWSSAKCTMRT